MTEADLLTNLAALRADADRCNAGLNRDPGQVNHDADAVLAVLRDLAKGEARSKTLAQTLGYPQRPLNSRLHYLREKGMIERVSKGIYCITAKGREKLAREADNG